MIEPTDAASDADWEAGEETASETADGSPPPATRSSAGDSTLAPESDPEAALKDEALESDNGQGAEADDLEDDEDADAPKKRRRRKRRSDALPAPDERTQAAVDFVSKVVLEMGMDCRVRLRRGKGEDDEDEVNIEIIGKDAGRIIGKKGSVLQAIQFLTHRAINRPGLDRRHVLVDAEGYRSRRDNSLATMARRLGKQAVDQGKIITFEPMNPRDRRVVHLALAKFEGVITKSDGEGDDRRVQIIPVRR